MTRLFIAIWPSDDVRRALHDLPEFAEPGVRPVPPENWHVTLRFLGDVDASAVAEVVDAVDSISEPPTRLRFGPSVVRLDGRQIVVPVTGADDIAAAVRRATSGVGVVDRRPFVGHLTVARARADARSQLVGMPCEADQAADELALVASELLPTGARYTTIHRRSLGS